MSIVKSALDFNAFTLRLGGEVDGEVDCQTNYEQALTHKFPRCLELASFEVFCETGPQTVRYSSLWLCRTAPEGRWQEPDLQNPARQSIRD